MYLMGGLIGYVYEHKRVTMMRIHGIIHGYTLTTNHGVNERERERERARERAKERESEREIERKR